MRLAFGCRSGFGERAPFIHRQHEPEMRHRHVVAIDRVGSVAADCIGSKVSDDLMTVEVEIHPVIGAPSLGTTEQIAIEPTRCAEVVDRERQMKGWQCHRAAIVIAGRPKQ